MKRDFIKFESEKRNERNTEKSDSIFLGIDRTCFGFNKKGIVQNIVLPINRNLTKIDYVENNMIQAQESWTYCQILFHWQNNEILCNKKLKKLKKFKPLFWKNKDRNILSYFSSENKVEHQDFIIDSGLANYIIKDKSAFSDLDEHFSDFILIAVKKIFNIRRKRCFLLKMAKEIWKKIFPNMLSFVPDNSSK